MKQTKATTLILLLTLSGFLSVFTSLSAYGQQDRWSRIDRDPQQMEKFSGYYNQTELNLGTGLGIVDEPYSQNLAGVTTVNGYMFNPSFQAGLGVGVLKYDAGSVVPLYLDSRYYVIKKRTKTFAGLSGGYLVALKDNFNGGTFLNPAVGITVPLKNRSSMTFSAGVLTQWEKDSQRDSFANFKVGIMLW